MSSHHFVKEGQEPALIVANGAQSSFKLIKELLEWCPFVVVLDGAYHKLLELQIKPDIVIGDFDSINNYTELADIEYLKIEDQNTTDLEKGIEYLRDRGFKDINVVWASGKRLDHTVNNISTLGKYSELNIVLYDDHSRAFVLPKQYKKHYTKAEKLSLIPLGKVENITSSGLKYQLKNESLETGVKSGSSNEALEDGIVSIEYGNGTLILVESIDEN